MNPRPPVLVYGVAILAVAAGTALRLALGSWLGGEVPFITFFPAVALSAWYGGLGAGALTAVLGAAVAAYLFPLLWTSQQRTALVLFLAFAGFISYLCEALIQARQRARKAEEAERRQRRTWRQTLAGIGDAVISTDKQGRIEFINAMAERLTGCAAADAAGRPLETVFRAVQEDTGEAVENPAARVLRDDAAARAENRTLLIRADGERISVEHSAAPIRDDTGELIGAVLFFRDVGPRRRAERELRQSRERVTTILESIHDAFVALDSDWRHTYVNAEAGRVSRLGQQALLGKRLWDVFPAMNGTPLERELRRAMAERAASHFEYYHQPWDQWFDVRAYPSDDGGISVFFVDITERKSMERRLSESEANLRLALRASRMGVWRNEMLERRVEWSPELEQIFGMEPGSFDGTEEAFFERIVEEDRPKVAAAVEQAVRERSDYAVEFRFIRPDGSIGWMEGRGLTLYGAAGQPVRRVGVGIDVTARKEAEEALREHSETIRALLESASQAILTVDETGRIGSLNALAERMFGYRREELVGQPVEVLTPEQLREGHALLRTGFFAHPRTRPMGAGLELSARRKDGVEFPVEISLSHVRTKQGALAFAFVTDITERRRSEEALRRTNENLQQFAYAASHDLKEPLRTVVSYLDLLALRCRDKLDAEGDQFIGFAREAAMRMVRLLSAMREYWQDGAELRPPVAVDCARAVEAALRNLEQAIQAAGGAITVHPLPSVMAEEAAVTSVFQNLVGNAVKYRRPNVPPKVDIGAECGGGMARFEVRDNGAGIESQYLSMVFRPFKRLHGRQYDGVGMGLALCRKMVERFGGRIWAESEGAGKGAVFYFTLPLAPSLPPPAGSPPSMD